MIAPIAGHPALFCADRAESGTKDNKNSNFCAPDIHWI